MRVCPKCGRPGTFYKRARLCKACIRDRVRRRKAKDAEGNLGPLPREEGAQTKEIWRRAEYLRRERRP